MIMVFIMVMSVSFPQFLETGFADWRDIGGPAIGFVGAGIVTVAAGAALGATAPAWVPAVGFCGTVVGLVGAGISLWDAIDGDDDPCSTCGDSGTPSGCSSCGKRTSHSSGADYGGNYYGDPYGGYGSPNYH